jgi:hypothetical protein
MNVIVFIKKFFFRIFNINANFGLDLDFSSKRMAWPDGQSKVERKEMRIKNVKQFTLTFIAHFRGFN